MKVRFDHILDHAQQLIPGTEQANHRLLFGNHDPDLSAVGDSVAGPGPPVPGLVLAGAGVGYAAVRCTAVRWPAVRCPAVCCTAVCCTAAAGLPALARIGRIISQ